jgi:ABC-type multidrug transport system fused ATPase/permease subunit
MKNYSVLSNVKYVFSKVSSYDKKQIVFMITRIITAVLVPFVMVLLPTLAIQLITSNVTATEFILKIGGLAIGLMIINLFNRYASDLFLYGNMPARLDMFIIPLCQKMILTDYPNIDYHENKIVAEKAGSSVQSNFEGPELMMNGFPNLIYNFLGLIVYASFTSFVSVWVIVVLFLMTLVNVLLSAYARKYEIKHKDELAKINRHFNYLYRKSKLPENGKDSRVYKMETWFYKVCKGLIKKRVNWHKRVETRKFFPNFSDSIFLLARDVVAYTILIMMFINNEIDATTFTFFLGIITGFSVWLNGVVFAFTEVKQANIGVNDYRAFIEKAEIFNHQEGIVISNSIKSPSIELENLVFTYPKADKPTIDNLSIKIKPGEKIALVGANGAGKTTLVKLLTGLYKADSGKIKINNYRSDEYNINDYYKLFSVIYQDSTLLAMSVLENIISDVEQNVNQEELWIALEKASIKDKIEKLKLKENTYITQVLEETGINFSGGETQKLLFAKALYKNAPIVILDEPTSALDPIAESELYQKYNDLMRDKTSIFISHRLASTKFCDRILFIEDGKITETGSHDQLMKKNGKYKELFDIQSHYYKQEEGESQDE